MICTVSNIIETLCNPEGRFRTLQGIIPDGESFEPRFSYSGAMANFHIYDKRKPYVLKCFLNPPKGAEAALRRIAACLTESREPWLVDYYYLDNEMLVFDDHDTCFHIDVILMERPAGITLDSFLADAAGRQDMRAIDKLMRVFCRTVSKWLASDVVHGNLKPNNILVTPDGSLKFLNYEYVRMPEISGGDPNGDNMAAANLALGLKVLACDPAAFRLLSGSSLFRLPMLRSSLLPQFAELAEASGCGPVRRVVTMLANSNYSLHDKPALISALETLAEDPAEVDPELVRKLFVRRAGTNTASGLLSLLSGQYDWAGPVSESLCCVERHGLWGYVDMDGLEVIPLCYDWADDFHEGRAVVSVNGEFALIDEQGNKILPAVYESIDWNSEYGLASIALDGKIGLFDRNGCEVVPLIYDWVGSIGPLILVRKDGLCGYIRPDGGIAIPLQFEDAFDFGPDGTALVISGGCEYFIDTSGEKCRDRN